jgi:tetratricopeptide (TPR) repeat protein
MNIMLGNAYKISNHKKMAIATFKEVLLCTPHAIEIMQILVDLGVDSAEILKTITDAVALAGQRGNSCSEKADFPPPLFWRSVVLALSSKKDFDHGSALASLQKVDSMSPKNSYVLLQMASLLIESDEIESAVAVYKQLRKADPYAVDGLDLIAKCLFISGDDTELSKLATDMLETNPRRAAGWLVAALCCAARGDHDKANAFIEKVRMQ